MSPDQGSKSDNEDFGVEDEILVGIDNNRPSEKRKTKQGPPRLPKLAARINRYLEIGKTI